MPRYITYGPDGTVTDDQTIPDPPETTNANTLRTQAAAALAANRTYAALASPTAAQTTAQVKRLTAECTALIRLILGQLDATD